MHHPSLPPPRRCRSINTSTGQRDRSQTYSPSTCPPPQQQTWSSNSSGRTARYHTRTLSFEDTRIPSPSTLSLSFPRVFNANKSSPSLSGTPGTSYSTPKGSQYPPLNGQPQSLPGLLMSPGETKGATLNLDQFRLCMEYFCEHTRSRAQQIGSRTRPCQDVKTDITQGKGRPSGSHPCDNNTAAEAPFDPEAILATMLSLLSSVDSASSVLYPYSLDVSASPTECSPIGDGHRTTSETSARVPKLKKKWSQTFQIHKSRSTSTPVSPRAEPIASTSKDALNTVAVDKLLELLIVIISKAPADILPVTNTSHNHADSTACDDSLLSPTGATAPVSTPIMDLILKAVIAWIRLSAVSKREWSSPSTERSDLAWQLSDPEQPILPNEDDILEARQKVIERLAYMASPQLSSAIAMTAGASTSRTLLAFGTISPDTSSDIGHCCTGAGASTPFQSQIHGPTWKNPTSSTSAHGTTPSLSLPPWRKKSAATPSRPIESMLTSTATVERKMSKPIKLPSRPTPRARKRQNHHLFALSKILEEKPAVGASILSQGGVPLAVSAVIRMPDVTTDFEEAQAAYPPHDGEDRLFQESADPGMDTAELPQEKPQVLSTMVGSSSTSMAAVDSTIKGSKHWSTPFNFEALATHTSTTANTTTLFQEIAEPSTTDINKAEKTWNSSQLMPKTNSLQSIDCLWAKKGRRISEKPRLVLKQQLIHSIKTTGSTSLKSENKCEATSPDSDQLISPGVMLPPPIVIPQRGSAQSRGAVTCNGSDDGQLLSSPPPQPLQLLPIHSQQSIGSVATLLCSSSHKGLRLNTSGLSSGTGTTTRSTASPDSNATPSWSPCSPSSPSSSLTSPLLSTLSSAIIDGIPGSSSHEWAKRDPSPMASPMSSPMTSSRRKKMFHERLFGKWNKNKISTLLTSPPSSTLTSPTHGHGFPASLASAMKQSLQDICGSASDSRLNICRKNQKRVALGTYYDDHCSCDDGTPRDYGWSISSVTPSQHGSFEPSQQHHHLPHSQKQHRKMSKTTCHSSSSCALDDQVTPHSPPSLAASPNRRIKVGSQPSRSIIARAEKLDAVGHDTIWCNILGLSFPMELPPTSKLTSVTKKHSPCAAARCHSPPSSPHATKPAKGTEAATDSLVREKKNWAKLEKVEGQSARTRHSHGNECCSSKWHHCNNHCHRSSSSSRNAHGCCCCCGESDQDPSVTTMTGRCREHARGRRLRQSSSNENIWRVVEQWQAWSTAHLPS